MFQAGFDDNFPGYPENWLVRYAGEVLKTMRIHIDDWIYLKSRAMFEIAWDGIKMEME